jgi:tetratricopeptide (TPR) repeat protein
MSKRIIIMWLGISLCMAGVAQGHIYRSKDKCSSKFPTPAAKARNMTVITLTPAGKAKLAETSQLDQAATAAMNAGNYAEAETDARQSIQVGPDSGIAQNVLAAALDAQGKTQEALQAYKTNFDLGAVSPSDVLPYALLLLKSGQWAQAVEIYNRQLPYDGGDGALVQDYSDFNPDVPRPMDMETAIHIGLGLELGWYEYHGTYQERTQQALAQFQKALTLEPDAPLANYYYGYGLRRMGHWKDAQVAFKKAAALDQGNGDVKAAAEKALAGR